MVDIQKIINDSGLRIYGAAKLVCSQTHEPQKTVAARIKSWIENPPRQWRDLLVFLDVIEQSVKPMCFSRGI